MSEVHTQMGRMFRAGLLAVLLGITTANAQGAKGIPVAEAYKHDGEEVTVEFVVKASKIVNSAKRGTYASLNSEKDYRAPSTLLVLVSSRNFGKFSAPGGIDKYFLGKQVRATGKVQLPKSGAAELWVTDAKQLTVINANPPKDPGDDPPPAAPLSDDDDPNPPDYLWFYIIGGGVVLLLGALVARQFRKPPEESEQ